jgi:hypothetical protein
LARPHAQQTRPFRWIRGKKPIFDEVVAKFAMGYSKEADLGIHLRSHLV